MTVTAGVSMIIEDYKAEIASLTAEVERLKDWKKLAEDRGQVLENAIKHMKAETARASSAEAQVERLRAALQPFADGAKEIPESWPNGRFFLIAEDHPENPKKHALVLSQVGDYRHARTALQSTDRSGG